MTSNDEKLKIARSELESGDKEHAAMLLIEVARNLSSVADNEKAAKIFEEAALVYRDLGNPNKSYEAIENATLMLTRQESSSEIHRKIVRVNVIAANIAEQAKDWQRSANFCFRALDFIEEEEEKQDLVIKAADALENLADIHEEKLDFGKAIELLKKVGRLYYTAGDIELGERINSRAIKLAMKWGMKSQKEGDLLSAGNALAEAAQILQMEGDLPEATRIMMEAGENYEKAGLYEKAGNIYDAAHEAFKFQRLTSARKQAMTKAAEAYLKMDGKPEVVAPLLVKAGNLFKELGRVMKIKWAFQRASDLFGELANKAKDEKDHESEKRYLRFKAMSLKNGGKETDAEGIYRQVIDYYLEESERERQNGNKETQAIALEEASEVLSEAGQHAKAKTYLEQAIELYVELADETSKSDQNDESSKHYARAAECATRLGDEDRRSSFHWIASDKASAAAKFYEELGVPELATIWLRTAGKEALKTKEPEMIEKAIELLRKSASGFKSIKELSDAFEDLFLVFSTLFEHYPEARDDIAKVLKEMEEIARSTQEYKMASLIAVLDAVEKGHYTAALLTLQEREEELLSMRDRLIELVEISKSTRVQEKVKSTGRIHWVYK